MNKIKLIALDLDGTALTPQNKVAETTTDAVRRAREAGVYVAVSTGRICGEARDFAVDLDADDLTSPYAVVRTNHSAFREPPSQ